MAREINPNIRPPNGYRFTERDGVVFVGRNWRSVEKQVKAYRQRNNFEPGEPWAEIMTQTCGDTPGFCGETSANRPPDSSGMSFNQRINEWMAWALGKKRLKAISLVSAEVTQARAAICAACPMQRALSQSCGACIRSIKAAREALLDGSAPAFQNLHPCDMLKEDCATSVHLSLTPSNVPDLPANCWRRA